MQPTTQPATLTLSAEALAEHEALRADAEVRLSTRLREAKNDTDIEVGLTAFIHEVFFSFAQAALDSHVALQKHMHDAGQPQAVTVVRRALEDYLSSLVARVFDRKHSARHKVDRNKYKGRFCTLVVEFITTRTKAWEQLQQGLSGIAQLQANGFIYTESAHDRFRDRLNLISADFPDDQAARWSELKRALSAYVYNTLGEAEHFYRAQKEEVGLEEQLRRTCEELTNDAADDWRYHVLEWVALPRNNIVEFRLIERAAVQRFLRDVGLPSKSAEPSRGKHADPIVAERWALWKQCVRESADAGVTRVTELMVAAAAGWSDRTPVSRWKRNDPKCTAGDDIRIRTTLRTKPWLKASAK